MRDAVMLVSALGCGLVAGFFWAFSVCVMRALRNLPPAQGIAAMQSINVVVINPWFLAVFLGTVAASVVALIASSTGGWAGPGSAWTTTGSVLYVIGAFGVTMLFNVPKNNALAKLAPDSGAAATFWVGYLSRWTWWNHVRAVAALAAAVCFTVALRSQ